jgi:tRNA-2-methylthio-N6-dimethylallyladenosine synthase
MAGAPSDTHGPDMSLSMPDAPGAKKVFVKTYGCQMNVYDSERIAEALAADGYQETTVIEDADVVVLNTCHIREKAAEKVYSELGRIRDIKANRMAAGHDTIVTIAGCVAQAEGSEITRRQPAVDLVIGPQSTHRLAQHVKSLAAMPAVDMFGTPRSIVETEFPEDDKFQHLPPRKPARATAAFLTVQEGCDKFCTFCVVPYTRGTEFSRPIAQIVGEAQRMVEQGVREITLLGQNVNGFHGAGADGRSVSLAGLIKQLAAIDGLERLRYTTSHPRDMGDDLFEIHATEAKLMPYLHLPIQSGADRILAAMNRKHTAAEYLTLVDRIRRARPDIALSTDLIVGFPGETEGEFQATLDIVRDVRFAQAYSFKYSARPGTPAAMLADPVPEEVKVERLHRLQTLLARQSTSFNESCIGKVFPVLFEKPGRRQGQLIGRSPYLQSVFAEADHSVLGRIVPVKISAALPNSLAGQIQAA